MNLGILSGNVQRETEMKKARRFSGMSSDYYEDDLYTGEDYDDEVFATLNSEKS